MDELSDIFLVGTPGLEEFLLQEVKQLGFTAPKRVDGGVTIKGDLADVYRANLQLRGATRVLLRIASFRAMHLAQLDKRARKVNWAKYLSPNSPIHVEASCKKSKIYHSKAAAARVEGAIVKELGGQISKDAPVTVKLRIEDDLCTISIDTTGDSLHKRDLKGAVGKAPLRETLAAMCLRAVGFDGTQTLVDPMCGSGTFPIEAAEIAYGLWPGRARKFAFEHLARGTVRPTPPLAQKPAVKFFGFDRDAGAIQSAQKNAHNAGVSDATVFNCQAISELQPPETPPGIFLVNPPYGARIGNRKPLFGLYSTLGRVVSERFEGWRFGMVTSDQGLANATDLKWTDTHRFINGGLQVSLYIADL